MADEHRSRDKEYLDLILRRIEVCKAYKPKFGQGKTISFEEFQILYGTDPFYSWFGLDNPLIYASHKAAGGITSLYRQIGVGCEQLFRRIIQDQFGLTEDQTGWSYSIKVTRKRFRTLTLDGRISLEDLESDGDRKRVKEWIDRVALEIGIDRKVSGALKGIVFEVRQGYKSKDSKRQNADIANAGTAYSQAYLPVVLILSTQIDSDVAERYRAAGWLLLKGNLSDSPVSSTYAFCQQVLGYDLAGFLRRNSSQLKKTIDQVLEALLRPEGNEEADELSAAEEFQDDDEITEK